LPLAARAIKEPFGKGWLNAEYQKLGTYEEFKVRITQLLWNDQLQTNTRCIIFRDKYMQNGTEILAEHYLKYVNLAGSLQPPLTAYDLLGALTAHYPFDIQNCMISANLKSNQDALIFVGELQVLNEEERSYNEGRQEQNTRDFGRKEYRNVGPKRKENRRECQQSVGHVRYERRQSHNSRPLYAQQTPPSNQRRNYQGRAGGNPTDSRPLHPQVPEFYPANGHSRNESNPGPLNRAGNVAQNQGN
jgi:hypothetical protein